MGSTSGGYRGVPSGQKKARSHHAAVVCSTAALLIAAVILVLTIFWKSIAPDDPSAAASARRRQLTSSASSGLLLASDILLEPSLLVAPYLTANTSLQLTPDGAQWKFRRKHQSTTAEDDAVFDCASLPSLARTAQYSAGGWSKAVYQAKRGSRTYALKMIDANAVHMLECLQTQSLQFCYAQAAIKLLKELALFTELKHDGVIKLRGYCIPAHPLDVPEPGAWQLAVITDWATPVQLINVLQMDWESRLQLLASLSSLLVYLSRTPLGSLGVTDFRRQQFVWTSVDSGVQLIDVDDVALLQPSCRTSSDCARVELSVHNTECIQSLCVDYNQALNLANAHRVFYAELLLPDVPFALWPDAVALLHDLKSGQLSARELHTYTMQLAQAYSTMRTVDNNVLTEAQSRVYDVLDDSSLPRGGPGAFSCERSRLPGACELTVVSAAEARALCTTNPHCQAVVINNQRSWTGRLIIELKTSVAGVLQQPGSVVYRIRR